ncbi:MAG: DeoR/GlpR family DNA-binding transcription regulator [Eubacteriales bacterium]|nr:DeoR/GlpR family DNA-binding transcription regulator [Eubacteriales bacterium]
MFQGQRIEVLKSILQEKKSVDISTLTSALSVSDVTVRKYLDILEREGFLKKMHGGAILIEDTDRDDDESIAELNAKENIAELALTMIEDGDSIFLGPGTSCYLLAKKLHLLKNITVVTNNVNVLEIIAPVVRNLYFIGGEIVCRDGLLYSYGQKALTQLEGMFVQKAFITVEGVDLFAGLTINDIGILDIILKVEAISRKLIIMADHNKFNKIGLHHVMPIDKIKIYISNERLDENYKKFFYENDIKILTSYDI